MLLFIAAMALSVPAAGPVQPVASAEVLAKTGIAQARSAIEAKNYALALQRLRPLADSGNAEAAQILGWMYRTGNGVAADPAEAVRLYHRVAGRALREWRWRAQGRAESQ
jgi:TPR repeat protein